jgi:hypothetical protein
MFLFDMIICGSTDNSWCEGINYYIVIIVASAATLLNLAISLFISLFITFQFPEEDVPWSAWNDNNQIYRNIWKLLYIAYSRILN